MVATRESAALAEKLIAATCAGQGITAGQLTIHADRGSSMTSKPVAFLLADLGITQSHSRPHVSNDNPFSEAQLPGSGQGSHLPAPADPDVSLSAHPARAVQSFGQYRSAQCANSRGASFLTSFSHSRARLSLRSSRLYFRRAQRIRWRSMRSQSGITLLG
jgi:transposase InsO family protein